MAGRAPRDHAGRARRVEGTRSGVRGWDRGVGRGDGRALQRRRSIARVLRHRHAYADDPGGRAACNCARTAPLRRPQHSEHHLDRHGCARRRDRVLRARVGTLVVPLPRRLAAVRVLGGAGGRHGHGRWSRRRAEPADPAPGPLARPSLLRRIPLALADDCVAHARTGRHQRPTAQRAARRVRTRRGGALLLPRRTPDSPRFVRVGATAGRGRRHRGRRRRRDPHRHRRRTSTTQLLRHGQHRIVALCTLGVGTARGAGAHRPHGWAPEGTEHASPCAADRRLHRVLARARPPGIGAGLRGDGARERDGRRLRRGGRPLQRLQLQDLPLPRFRDAGGAGRLPSHSA